MRALFVYKQLTLGGVEAVLRARLEGLPAFGIEAHAWFLADGEGRALFRGREAELHIGGLNDLQRFLEHWQPSVLTSVDSEEILPVVEDLAWEGRFLLECHTPYSENRLYLAKARTRREVAVIVPSRYQAQVIRPSVPALVPILVVPNPIDEAFNRDAVTVREASGPPILAWVGRLDHLKNWDGFLEVGRHVQRLLPQAEFWLASTASSVSVAASLEREAKRKGILARLRWYAGLPHEHMPRWLDRVRNSGGVFISTSRGESFGMAVAEAMARGCAVVVPRFGPFAEFVDDGVSGLMYAPGKASEAAERIVKLVTNRDLRDSLGDAARESILASHSPSVALRALAETLRGIAADGRAPSEAVLAEARTS